MQYKQKSSDRYLLQKQVEEMKNKIQTIQQDTHEEHHNLKLKHHLAEQEVSNFTTQNILFKKK